MPTPIANVAPQLRYNATWNTVPVLAGERPTVIERGYTDEGTIRPGHMSMRINDNASPTLNPSRPASLLYGITGRGMGVALSADASLRAWMETALLDPDQTTDFTEAGPRGKRWIDLDAYGPLYRIGQWSDELQPPMTRTFLQFSTLTGLWPGDDAALSTRVGLARSYTGVTLQDASAPAGATASFVGSATTSVVLSPLNASTTAGFQVFFSTKLGSMPVIGTPVPFMTWRANGLLWSLEIDAGSFTIRLYSGGVLIDTGGYGFGGTNFLDWVAWRAKCYQSGGNIVLELAWYTTANGVLGVTRSVAGTIDRLTSLRINGNSLVNGTRYSQIGSLSGVADDLQSFAALQSFEGYRGETTAARFTRLLSEAGISNAVQGTTTTKMGPQKTGRLMDLLKEVAATEDGLIFDKKDAIQVILRTRRHRMNQAAVMTLAAGTDIVPPFKERVDNVGVQNFVTITDRSGAVAAASRNTGPMSTAAYPDGIGVFKGGAFPDEEVNLFDPTTDLPVMAAWYLARGTVPGPRFPTVTIEVGIRSPGLRAAAKALEIGDRILVTGRLSDPIDLHVIGITEEVGTHAWKFTLTCIPGDVFDVGGEDDTAHRLDAYASTIITAPAPASTGVTMVVGSPDPADVWSTTSLPYTIAVAGERMLVTAATAPALVSGTWRQTLTLTRSTNGVVKAQIIGAPVRVATPYREAW
jgi:hypothetical protein